MTVAEQEVQRLMSQVRILREEAIAARATADRVVEDERRAGRDPIGGKTPEDRSSFQKVDAAYKAADAIAEKVASATDALHRILDGASAHQGQGDPKMWATTVATRLLINDGVKAALFTDPIEVPTVVEPEVVAFPENPRRLIDVITERRPLVSNTFEYLRQTARTNLATVVADHAQKPTSTFTVAPIEDRARVIAHLSEVIPERFLMDEQELIRWLSSEMFIGVLDGLEEQFVSGSGIGENFTGVLNTPGHTVVPWQGSIPSTLRRARTTLQLLEEDPNAWVLSPEDAETIDLEREGEDGMFLLGEGHGNVFGDIPIVVSTSVGQGTALLADWRQSRLWVRESMKLSGDRSGDLFEHNEVKFRAEGRFGIGFLRPQAFAEIELTDAS